ncbi:hypothetical protein [Massilistercora timonensis]|uniref:hypothetical protein n=1 Tax=Massilistercora timonensis TaxID=2086584 RepID=UPI003208E58D
MFQPSKLLKVMSVIFIILGVLGLIGTGFSYAMLPTLESIEGVDMSLVTETLTPLNLALSIVSCVSSVGAGIAGIRGRSRRRAVIFIGLYSLLTVISLIQTAAMGLFNFGAVLDVVVPVLYWWGLYQSEERG